MAAGVVKTEQWKFVRRFMCASCAEFRSRALEAIRLVNEKGLSEEKAAIQLSVSPESLKMNFPVNPSCCIHALEEHLVDWIRAMAQLGDHLTLREVYNCAQLAMDELNGDPFEVDEWIHTFLGRNPAAAESLALEEKQPTQWTYHAALGDNEGTFKSIVSLVHSLGIYMRKADLTQLAMDCVRVLNWRTSFPCHFPGPSWCRRFVVRHPDVSQYLYVPNRVAAYYQLDGVRLLTTLKPFIDLGRTSLNDVERQHLCSQLPITPKAVNESVCDEDDTFPDPCNETSTSHNNSNLYSFPNKTVRNAIIEDVLNILSANKSLTTREEMCTAVKIIAELFCWKTIYENNLPSKSWTLRFMSERPQLKQYLAKARVSSYPKLEPHAFQEAVTKAIEESTQAQKYYPEYYAPVE